MRIHSDQTITRLKLLRNKGRSIHEIMRELSLPKTTVWHHVQNIKLPTIITSRLRSAGGRSSKLRKEMAIEKAKEESLQYLGGHNKYFVSLIAMLYWAEGDNKNSFSFVNTNANMVKLFIRILEKFFGINNDRLLITVRYFTGMDKNKCVNFWSDVTGVPKKQIRTYYNDGGSRGRTEFGMCRVGVQKSGYLFKLMRSIIENISNNLPS